MSSDSGLRPPIIIDCGTGYTKFGLSNQESVPQIVPSIIGSLKYNTQATNNKVNKFIGKQIDLGKRRLYKFSYPIKRGSVENWDDLQQIWKHAYSNLSVSSKQHPVLLTSANIAKTDQRNKALQILFEKMQVPAVLVASQPILSLFSTGKSTGIILNCGDGVTQATPIYQGYSLAYCSEKIDFSGRDVTQHLRNLIKKTGICLDTSADYQIIKEIKQKFCSVSQSFGQKNKQVKQKFSLPDGHTIELTNNQKQAGQILFSPEKVGLEFPSIVKLVANSILKVDIDLRRCLFNQIILAGGSTMMEGFPQKFVIQTKRFFPSEANSRCFAPQNRDKMSWEGGKVISNMPALKHMWISRSDYMQHKQKIIKNKIIA